MSLAEMDGTQIFIWMVVAAIAWVIYMATFRTEDFLKLMEKDRERKREQWKQVGSAAKTGFTIARWFMKR